MTLSPPLNLRVGMARPQRIQPSQTQIARAATGGITGLSPRVRGNLQKGDSLAVSVGSIPACTGEPGRGADTLEVAGQKVRLQGIDAPESGQSCRQATGQRYQCGEHATQALRTRIGPDAVTCTIEGRDRYTRALGICYAADGTDLNGWLVSQGHALAYRKYSTKYVPQEDQAKAAQAGLWAGAFVPPWDWRRGARLD